MKFVENCKTSQRFWVSRQILDKIGVQLRENLYCLKDILISFHVFYFMKYIVWFLSYVISKFTISGFLLKMVNLPFWIDLGCQRQQILTLKYKIKNPKQKMLNKLPKETKTKKWKIKHAKQLRTQKRDLQQNK